MRQAFWNKRFVSCLALQALYMLSFNMVTPLIAQYVVSLGESAATAGLIAGLFSFLALLFRPLVGYAADRVDKKLFLEVGILAGFLSLIGYGFSQTAFLVAVFRVPHAFALCVQTTIITVLSIEFVPSDRAAEAVGYVSVASMVGMTLGPSLGVLLVQVFNHQFSFFLAAGVMLTGSMLAIILPKSPPPRKWGDRITLTECVDMKTLPLSVIVASFAYCAGLTTSFMVLVGEERGVVGAAAVFFCVASFGMVLVRPATGRYADGHGVKLLGWVAFSSETLCMATVALTSSFAGIVAAAVFRVFGQGIGQSSLQGQALKDAPAENRGRASSTFYIGVDCGQGMGAIAGGCLAHSFGGYSASYASGALVLSLGSLAFAVWLRKHRLIRGAPQQERDGALHNRGAR